MGLESLDIAIRDEAPEDVAAIRDVTQRAFASAPHGDGREPELIDALRREGAFVISLVAIRNDKLVGHIAFSPATAGDGAPGWHALGPVSVEPNLQRKGIGSRLIEQGIERLRERGAAGCIVLGDPSFYRRFGFHPAPNQAPAGYPAEYFMTLPFVAVVAETTIDFHPLFGNPPSG